MTGTPVICVPAGSLPHGFITCLLTVGALRHLVNVKEVGGKKRKKVLVGGV